MPITQCLTCHNDYSWSWTDAFDKFGFGDGEGQVMTEDVARVLRHAGYTVTTTPWGLHNIVIDSIELNGIEQIPYDLVVFGYGDPRQYLPPAIIDLLDRRLPDHGEVVS